MKAPELNELISESYPIKRDYIIDQLKNKLFELDQENIFYKKENKNLEEEIKSSKKSEYEMKSKLSIFITQINNLKEENDKMKIINQKLVEDNKILMSEIDKKISQINNIKEKNELEQKEIIIEKLNSELNEQENYIKKLFEDNKELNETNKNIIKETEEKINELNMNIKILNEEINIKNEKINKLEQDLYKINISFEEINKENICLNNMNLSLKEKNKELNDIINNNKTSLINLEQKNNEILLELNKKEKIINDFQEKYKIQSKQNSNLINKYNSIINTNKDSLILINKIKSKNSEINNKYENIKTNFEQIKNIFENDDSLEKILTELKQEINNEKNNEAKNDINDYNNNGKEFDIENIEKTKSKENIEKPEEINNFRNYIDDNKNKENKEEMTMDKKYNFLFDNNKK